jgi:hypothetical protein
MMFGTPTQLRNSRLEELAHTVQLPCVNSELLINASALEWFTLLAKRKCMKYPFNLYQPSTGKPRANLQVACHASRPRRRFKNQRGENWFVLWNF